ncbi:hypothetical protein [Phenylobacterium immobile]|uniref:hypothetical protein n=1 Tax=Phenylobacterium immobile TaxID=21 RepID=UPI000A6BFAA3|nr:hypothetical protein [Phenylobacterium immobile]
MAAKIFHLGWAHGVAAAALMFSSAALAQSSAALDEIVVTAQKRTENINDVPVSVTAVAGEKLDVDFNNLTGFVNDPATWGVELKARF